MKIILSILITLTLNAQLIKFDLKPKHRKSDKFMSIKILDSREVSFEEYNDIAFNEVSALAYKDKILYALSNKGNLYHLKIKFKKNKIADLKLLKAVHLKKKNSKRLKKKSRDAEGMVLVDDKLYISFERKPRIDVFSLNGKKLAKYKIAKELRDPLSYQSKNKALESVAYSKKYGILTAPELPLDTSDDGTHIIYAKDKKFKFKSSAALSAMEFVDSDRLLTLERSFNHLTRRRVLILKELDLSKTKKGLNKMKVLAVLDSSKGWNLDNFEGLCKVDKNKFLMISDDNRNFFQKTILVLFEIKP
jgi:hypothetical protein